MLLASQERPTMNARGINYATERQNLLDRLLDAVKQCQVRFGGKTELATDDDSRVICLLSHLSAIFGHGLKKPKGKIRAFMQVGQVAGITKQQELEPDFYIFIKEHISKNEVERFAGLHHVNTDAGRGRAWLRSTLNEHTLEKSIHGILGNKKLLRLYYETESFLLDEEKSSMLPMISAGISSILFALGIDKEELNVKQVSMPMTKEVFSNLLPSFPTARPKEDPAAIVAENIPSKENKKKKKKKKNAAIVSIDDIDEMESSREDLCHDTQTSPKQNNKTQKYFTKPSKPGHSRSSSYPGKINIDLSDAPLDSQINIHGISREISLSDDSISKLTEKKNSQISQDNYSNFSQPVETIEENDERYLVGYKNDSTRIASPQVSSNDLTSHHTDDYSPHNKPELLNSLFSVKSFKPTKHKTDNTSDELFDGVGAIDNDMLPRSVAKDETSSSFVARDGTSSNVVVDGDNLINSNTEDDKSSNFVAKNTLLSAAIADEDWLPRQPGYVPDKAILSNEDNMQPNFVSAGAKFSSSYPERDFISNTVAKGDILPRHTSIVAKEDVLPTQPRTIVREDFLSNYNTKDDIFSSPDAKEASLSSSVAQEELLSSSVAKEDMLSSSVAKEDILSSSVAKDDILSSSVAKDSNLLMMGGDDGLLPCTRLEPYSSSNIEDFDINEDRNSSKDSISLSSNSWFDETDERIDQSEDDLLKVRSDSLTAATDAATAALELCSPADPMTSIISSQAKGVKNVDSQESTMSTNELKQALVSMMLRKDEIEEQNRLFHQLLEECQREKDVLQVEVNKLNNDINEKEEQSVHQISVLTRENEVLKHQLKKYVGAVQMLRSTMSHEGPTSNQALSGIRQDEVLPVIPEKITENNYDSTFEAEEYKQKLIQVAEMHGELMEFNERLQLQSNYWQGQALRLQEELIDLRGPLPQDSHAPSDDPLATAPRNRPLINVWIPSVFLKGKGSTGVHHLYQVYVRIKDDEWNVYRRYSQFLELHKKLYKNHKIVDTFKFPSKKTFGNRGTKFVEERRKSLQEYIRLIINLLLSTSSELQSNTSKETLVSVLPFFGDPYPPRAKQKKSPLRRKNTQPYDGL